MRKQVSYVLVFVLVVAGLSIMLATNRDPVERYARARGSAIGKSAQELVDRCKLGEIDAQRAKQILHILTPRLVNMMQHKMEGNSPLNMWMQELNLCWQLVLHGLLPPAQAETVLRCLDTSWCEYKPVKSRTPPRLELHENLTCPVQAIVLHHQVWLAQGNEDASVRSLQSQFYVIKLYLSKDYSDFCLDLSRRVAIL